MRRGRVFYTTRLALLNSLRRLSLLHLLGDQVDRKVFVVNDSGHDFSAAQRFGELVPMSSGLINKYKITEMHRTFSPFVEKSSPDDWILLVGPSVTVALACAMFSHRHGRLNLLLWRGTKDGSGDIYLPRKIQLK